jgi:hypothetical protein
MPRRSGWGNLRAIQATANQPTRKLEYTLAVLTPPALHTVRASVPRRRPGAWFLRPTRLTNTSRWVPSAAIELRQRRSAGVGRRGLHRDIRCCCFAREPVRGEASGSSSPRSSDAAYRTMRRMRRNDAVGEEIGVRSGRQTRMARRSWSYARGNHGTNALVVC